MVTFCPNLAAGSTWAKGLIIVFQGEESYGSKFNYSTGTTNYLEVLTAQQGLLQAQIGQINTELARANAVINLYQGRRAMFCPRENSGATSEPASW